MSLIVKGLVTDTLITKGLGGWWERIVARALLIAKERSFVLMARTRAFILEAAARPLEIAAAARALVLPVQPRPLVIVARPRPLLLVAKGDGSMAQTEERTVETPRREQGAEEKIAWPIDLTKVGDSETATITPVDMQVVRLDTEADVTDDVTTGSMSASEQILTGKTLQDLEEGISYRLKYRFTKDGNTLIEYFYVDCPLEPGAKMT